MLTALRMIAMSIHFLVTGILNIIVCLIRPFDHSNSSRVARLYTLPTLKILGLTQTLELDEINNNTTPAVIIGNHQSNFDLFVIGTSVPVRTITLGKSALRWVPFFGQIFALAGNVFIKREDPKKAKKAMLQTTEILKTSNTSIWVFAEGTRNKGKGLLPFKKGAFIMAIEAQVDIFLICVSSYKKTMQLDKLHSGYVHIKALPPISTKGLTLKELPALMAQCHAEMKACIDALDANIAEKMQS